MASISDLLIARGQQEADSRRRRAGAWVPLIQALSTLPGQVMQDRAAAREAEQVAFDRQQQRDVRAQQLAKGEQELATAEATAEQRRQMNELLATPGIIGDDNRFDIQGAQRIASEKGYRDILDDVLAFGKEWNEGVDQGLLRREQIDEIAGRKRQAANQAGVRRMIGESVAARGGAPITPAEGQTYQGMALQEGIELPAGLIPEPEEEVSMVIKGPGGRPTRVLVPKSQLRNGGMEEYREPSAPRAEQYVWAVDPSDGETKRMTEAEARAKGATQPQGSGGLGGAAVQLRNSRAAAALNSIERLKQLAPVRSPGPAGIAQGAAEVAKGYMGYSTKTRQFQALIQPTAMQMAAAIQGAANLSDNERKAMAEMLGSINTMDYESQMALLQHAADLVSSGADVENVDGKWIPVQRGAIKVKPGGVVPAGNDADPLKLGL